MRQNYIPSLTPLRGIAALMVVIYHYQVLITPIIDPEQSFLINKWYIMVDFFFVLSGFIITHVYQKKFSCGFQWPVFKKFMLARFARLYPLHLASLVIMIGLFLLIRNTAVFDTLPHFLQLSLDSNAIIANIFLLQTTGLFPEPTWNTPSWSISVEWWTYALFPFFIILLTKKRKIFKYSSILFILGAYLSIMFYFQPAQFAERVSYMGLRSELLNTVDVMVGSGFMRCIGGFLLGMLIYLAFEKNWGYSWLSRSSALFGLAFLFMTCWSFNIMPDIVSILLFAPFILMVAYNNGAGKKILSFKSFQFLGDISYSIYMIHFPIILCYYILRGYWKAADSNILTDANASIDFTVNTPASPPLWLAFTGLIIFIFATIFVAYLSYNYIEKPMRDFLKVKFNPANKQTKKISGSTNYEIKS